MPEASICSVHYVKQDSNLHAYALSGLVIGVYEWHMWVSIVCECLTFTNILLTTDM